MQPYKNVEAGRSAHFIVKKHAPFLQGLLDIRVLKRGYNFLLGGVLPAEPTTLPPSPGE